MVSRQEIIDFYKIHNQDVVDISTFDNYEKIHTSLSDVYTAIDFIRSEFICPIKLKDKQSILSLLESQVEQLKEIIGKVKNV